MEIHNFMKHVTVGDIPVYINVPIDVAPVGIIHFVHGMMEDIGDYEEMARYCTDRGYLMIRQEIPGHGEAAVDGKLGYMGKSPSGWNRAVRAIYQTSLLPDIKKDYPGLPYFLVGFSIGSFLVRQALIDIPELKDCGLTGVCLIGAGNKSAVELKIAKSIAKSRMKKFGEDNISGVVVDLMLDNYNKKFKDSGFSSRWLFDSIVKQKNFDPKGYTATPELFYDFVINMLYVRDKVGILKDFPLLLMSGSEDPVTGNMKTLVKTFKKLGCQNITDKTFLGKRHHILRDVGAEKVYERLINWCNAQIVLNE